MIAVSEDVEPLKFMSTHAHLRWATFDLIPEVNKNLILNLFHLVAIII